MEWIKPKTDWLPTDAINYADFNRIENNISYTLNYLNQNYFLIPQLTIVTNRTNRSIDFLSSINRIEANLETIKTKLATPIDWQNTKKWEINNKFSFEDANRLEKSIEDLREISLLVVENYSYCGVPICGEGGLIY